MMYAVGIMGLTALLALLPTFLVPAALLLARGSVWPAVLTYHAFCLGIPIASRCSNMEAGLVRSELKSWAPLTMLLSVFVLAAGMMVQRWIDLRTVLPPGYEMLLARIHPWRWYVVYSLAVNPFAEEYLWRGFLLRGTGIARGGLCFWLMHAAAAWVFVRLPNAVVYTLPALGAGLAWGWMRSNFGTLWPAILTHLATDAAILYVASHLL